MSTSKPVFSDKPLQFTTIKPCRQDHPTEINNLATHLLTSLKTNTQIPRLQTTFPSLNLTQETGYQTASCILSLRSRTDTAIGRKLGFTNRNIWTEYNIDSPNWSYIYASTTTQTLSSPSSIPQINLSQLSNLEPRIEPELIIGLHPTNNLPTSKMTDIELLSCISWLAPGFEIVISPFPNWVFNSAETTAAFALHGKLLIGPPVQISELGIGSAEQTLAALEAFEVELLCDGEVVDRGVGRNVLGSPVKALRFLVELLEADGDGWNPGVAGGEVVTTGTLTRALPITSGEVWEMRVRGLGERVDGVKAKFMF